MKRKFIILVALMLLIFPFTIKAESTDENGYVTTNLEEALTQEGIKHNLDDYKEDDKQAIIYLFRGHGCGYCQAFLTFLNSIVDDYGKYFRLVSYEVWEDKDNSKLLNQVAEFTGEEAGGVPYIIIGEKVFPGYIEDWDEDIKKAIKEQYDNKNEYDVMKEMAKAQKEDKTTSSPSDTNSKWWNLGFITASTIIIIIFLSTYNKKLNNRIDVIYEKLGIELNNNITETVPLDKEDYTYDDEESAEEALAEKNIAEAEKLLKEEKEEKEKKSSKAKK